MKTAILWITFCCFCLGCKCGIVRTDDLLICACGLGTEPLAVIRYEPNSLTVDYASKPQPVQAVWPGGVIQTD